MFTHSIRWRLQLWLAFLLVCLLFGFGVTVYQLERTTRIHQIDQELEHRLAALSGNLIGPGGPPPGDHGGPPDHGKMTPDHGFDDGPRGPPSRDHSPPEPPNRSFDHDTRQPPHVQLTADVSSLFNEADTNAFYFAVWNHQGILRRRSTNAPPDEPIFDHIASASGPQKRTRGTFRESFLQHTIGYQVLVGRNIAPELAALHRLAWLLVAAGAAVLAFGMTVGWWFTSRALRPLEDISDAAGRIAGGDLSRRITSSGSDDEIGRLAAVLNSTFDRLEAAFSRQKQFTADASHELRTPLAVMISEAQTILARERSVPEYRETVQTLLHAAQQMRRLTESLLQLARFDAGHEQLPREPLDLARRVQTCVENLASLANESKIKIHCQLHASKCFGNPNYLDQVITNLVTNAIHYSRSHGEIRIRTHSDDNAAILTVADDGIGIASSDLPHIFERFYRADQSRARAEGRSGLGLAICKAILDAEGATITVSSEIGIGTTFTVKYPQAATHHSAPFLPV